MKVATLWLNKLPIAEEDFKKALEANRNNVVLVQLRKIVQQKLNELSNLEISSDTYNSPNWQLIVADQAGQKRTLRQIDSLLSWVNI